MMKLTIPAGSFSAYLFDCDGTIANSMPLHYESWKVALAKWNCPFPEDLYYAWAGIPTPKIIAMLGEKYGIPLPVHALTDVKENIYLSLFPRLEGIPEVLEQIHLQYGKIPLAVVSGSPRESVLQTLTYLDVREKFEVVIGAENYENGKPAPDPFLLAAKMLGVEPSRCLVFEDADLGVQSAESAGMKWVRVAPPWERAKKNAIPKD